MQLSHHRSFPARVAIDTSGYLASRPICGLASAGLVAQWEVGCRFEAARKPGMYKDEYIQTLFEYYHEARNDVLTQTPMVPAWKVTAEGDADNSPEHFGLAVEPPTTAGAAF